MAVQLVVAAAVMAGGAYMSANAEKKAARFNARIMDMNAQTAAFEASMFRKSAAMEKKIGEYQAMMHRRQVAQLKGTQRANYAASGVLVDAGSPAAVIAETHALGVMDGMMIRHNATMASLQQRMGAVSKGREALSLRMQADMARRSAPNPYVAAVMSLAKSGASGAFSGGGTPPGGAGSSQSIVLKGSL